MKINLVRIDDRLIHGQVATVWSKEANAQRIIICSDEVAKDQIRKTLLLQVGPPGVKVSVVDVAKAVRVYNNPKYEKDTVFFLYTCPQDVCSANGRSRGSDQECQHWRNGIQDRKDSDHKGSIC